MVVQVGDLDSYERGVPSPRRTHVCYTSLGHGTKDPRRMSITAVTSHGVYRFIHNKKFFVSTENDCKCNCRGCKSVSQLWCITLDTCLMYRPGTSWSTIPSQGVRTDPYNLEDLALEFSPETQIHKSFVGPTKNTSKSNPFYQYSITPHSSPPFLFF